MFDVNSIIRENIKSLEPYSSARDEYSGEGMVWLDANENPFDSVLNRYPDPKQMELKQVVSRLKQVEVNQIFIGNGSDEVIDLLFRAFCNPKEDKAYVFTPTYGMYKVSAAINQVDFVEIPLDENFQWIDVNRIQEKIDGKGLLFICSPNNPTGNTIEIQHIQEIASVFQGLLVVDEAYIDFSESESAVSYLQTMPNVVVTQTLSKAFGLAGLRLGIAYANPEIINVLNKVKPPYNVNTYSQLKAIEVLKNKAVVDEQIECIKTEREKLRSDLKSLEIVKKVYPSQANFLLVEFIQANTVYTYLKSKGIIIRNRDKQIENCLRISIGTPNQNQLLLETLKTFTL